MICWLQMKIIGFIHLRSPECLRLWTVIALLFFKLSRILAGDGSGNCSLWPGSYRFQSDPAMYIITISSYCDLWKWNKNWNGSIVLVVILLRNACYVFISICGWNTIFCISLGHKNKKEVCWESCSSSWADRFRRHDKICWVVRRWWLHSGLRVDFIELKPLWLVIMKLCKFIGIVNAD